MPPDVEFESGSTSGCGTGIATRRLPCARFPPAILLSLAVIKGTAFAADPANQRPTEERPAEVLAEFNIDRGCRPILLPVRIRGQEYLFCLDTGTTTVCFDTSLKNLLGKPLQSDTVHTTGGVTTNEFFDPPEAFPG